MVVAFLFAFGAMAVQFAGLGLTAAKVNHAAQEAAYVAGSRLEAATGKTPCWAVTGGLARPKRSADAAICQTVLENLGDVDPNRVTVAVSPDSPAQRQHDAREAGRKRPAQRKRRAADKQCPRSGPERPPRSGLAGTHGP